MIQPFYTEKNIYKLFKAKLVKKKMKYIFYRIQGLYNFKEKIIRKQNNYLEKLQLYLKVVMVKKAFKEQIF